MYSHKVCIDVFYCKKPLNFILHEKNPAQTLVDTQAHWSHSPNNVSFKLMQALLYKLANAFFYKV